MLHAQINQTPLLQIKISLYDGAMCWPYHLS